MITEIVDVQPIRQVLTFALSEGRGPRSSALDVVGRFNRASGRREGGVIGLHSRDIASSGRALDRLLSGDPGEMAKYLRMKTRDARFDRTVMRAIREGQAVPADKARKMVGRMQDRMLFNRGTNIARTELLGSLHHAQDEGIEQLIENGQLQRSQVKWTWDATNDNDTRESHSAMDGQVRNSGEPFVTGAGHRLMYPGDRSLGAPAEEIINCRCQKLPDIDFLAGL